jgi:hypothetical protein
MAWSKEQRRREASEDGEAPAGFARRRGRTGRPSPWKNKPPADERWGGGPFTSLAVARGRCERHVARRAGLDRSQRRLQARPWR